MFTGIIEAVGSIKSATDVQGASRITVDCGALDLSAIKIGDSIAVSGACLTALEIKAASLSFDVSPETINCTIGFATGNKVNLERSLRFGGSLDGHWVSGHVDDVGSVVRFEQIAGGNHLLAVKAPRELAKFIARKGSIAINGVSLTVNVVNDDVFEVNLIPHTLKATNLGTLTVGARVNLEADMLARYVERILGASK